jgi:hypothetical protein
MDITAWGTWTETWHAKEQLEMGVIKFGQKKMLNEKRAFM